MASAPRPIGRPKIVLTEEEARQVAQAIARGARQADIARRLRVNYHTWVRIKEEDERIKAAFAEARQTELEDLSSILVDKARAGDTTCLIFALKARHGYRDHGPETGGGETRVNVTISLPGAASSVEDYSKTIDLEAGSDGE